MKSPEHGDHWPGSGTVDYGDGDRPRLADVDIQQIELNLPHGPGSDSLPEEPVKLRTVLPRPSLRSALGVLKGLLYLLAPALGDLVGDLQWLRASSLGSRRCSFSGVAVL